MKKMNLLGALGILLLALLPALAGAATIDCGANSICTQNQACTCTASCTGFVLSLYTSTTSMNFEWEAYTASNSLAVPAGKLSQEGTKYVKALCDDGGETNRQPIAIQPPPPSAPPAPAAPPSGGGGTIEECIGLHCQGRASVCGNTECESPQETYENCCKDCGCGDKNKICINNTCKYRQGLGVAYGGCGNNRQESQEQCDGTDAKKCPGFCREDCTCPFVVSDGRCDTSAGENYQLSKDCPAPACGNNQLDAGEQCDRAADSACPGLCKPSCQCFIAGDGKCEKRAGENRENSSDCEGYVFFTWPIILPLLLIVLAVLIGAVYFLKIKSEQKELAERQSARIPARSAAASPGASRLSSYVADMLDKGYTPEQIKSQLRLAGWPEDKIEEALAS